MVRLKLVVLGIIVFILGGIVFIGFTTRWGKITELDKPNPPMQKLDSVSTLLCQEVMWGHVHTGYDAFTNKYGTKGWSKIDPENNNVSITVLNNKITLNNTKHANLDGEFTLQSNQSDSQITGANAQRSILIDKNNGQVIVNIIYDFANGVGSDSVVYSCRSVGKTDPISLLSDIPEVKLINQKIAQVGHKTEFLTESISGNLTTIEYAEDAVDHQTRIATFLVNIDSGEIMIYDVVANKNITLAEWQAQVRKTWKF